MKLTKSRPPNAPRRAAAQFKYPTQRTFDVPSQGETTASPSRRVLVTLFMTLFFAFAYVHQESFREQIPVSRLDLLHALVLHKTLRIDAYHENTSNKAVHEGHYYSDKAPACVLLALPAFVAAKSLLTWCGVSLDSKSGWLISSWAACAGSLALVTALGGAALFAWLCRWVYPRYAYITTLGVFLGAAPLPYCTLLMPHGLTVGLLSIALMVGDVRVNQPSSAKLRILNFRDLLAGCCCGLALGCEYSAGVAVVGILLHLVIKSNLRRAFSLMLGMTPPLTLILVYHWLCFGSPFTLAYHHEAVFTQMHDGFFGIKWPPDVQIAFSLLFNRHVGLFFWSPVLLMVFVGYSRLFAISAGLFWITYLVPVIQIVAISAYFLPFGGGLLGSRLLAPILPLVALPTALGISKLPRIGCILALVSILMTMLATVVGLAVPFENHWKRVIEGKFSYNLGLIMGLSSHVSLLPLLLAIVLGVWLTWRQP